MQFKLINNYLISLGRYTPFSGRTNFLSFSVLLVAVIFLCLACGNAERTTDVITAPEDGAQQLPPGEGLDIGALAPTFSLPDGNGTFHSLANHRGQKIVIVFYRTGT